MFLYCGYDCAIARPDRSDRTCGAAASLPFGDSFIGNRCSSPCLRSR